MKKVILSVFLCILLGLYNVCTAIPIAGEEADVFSRDPDSLRHLLSIETDDTSKVKLYCNLMAVYIDEKLDSAFLFLEPALKLAESIQWKEGVASVKTEGGRLYWRKGKFEQALSYHYDALVHYIKKGEQANIGALITYIGQDYADWGKYPEALVYFNKADSIFRKTGDKRKLAGNYLLFGFVYQSQGRYSDAVKVNYKALKIFEELGDQYGKAIAIFNIGDAYKDLGNYENALKNYFEGVRVFEEVKDKFNLATVYVSIGNIYILKGDYDAATQNNKIAYSIAKGINNGYLIGTALQSLGEVYWQQLKYADALPYFLEAATAFRGVSDYFDLSLALSKVGSCQTQLKQYDAAKQSFNEAYLVAQNLDSRVPLSAYYQGSEVLDSATGNWEYAYKNYKQYISYRDSSNSTESTKKILEQQIKYENDKKDALLIVEQNRKSEVQRVVRNSIIAGALTMLVLLMVLYNRYKLKLRTNKKLQEAYDTLQKTQQQLVQQEKLASLGALTAGIAHEIKNPLNFVNNYSELSSELIDEFLEATDKEEQQEIGVHLKQNLLKITEHGKRADSIVKNMLKHSRTGSGDKQLTDINLICEEYLSLAYHGMRANVPDFNCELVFKLEPKLPMVNCVAQDISRVILNLITNAFDEVHECEKLKKESENFIPKIVLTTFSSMKIIDRVSKQVIKISVRDNGRGIPEELKQRIFEPFFTTKPTGQGTGLGLSLSYEIIVSHGGVFEVNSKKGEGTEFVVVLPC